MVVTNKNKWMLKIILGNITNNKTKISNKITDICWQRSTPTRARRWSHSSAPNHLLFHFLRPVPCCTPWTWWCGWPSSGGPPPAPPPSIRRQWLRPVPGIGATQGFGADCSGADAWRAPAARWGHSVRWRARAGDGRRPSVGRPCPAQRCTCSPLGRWWRTEKINCDFFEFFNLNFEEKSS